MTFIFGFLGLTLPLEYRSMDLERDLERRLYPKMGVGHL